MSTEPEYVHFWRPAGDAETAHRLFKTDCGARMVDRKTRRVGCIVRVRPVEIASRPRRDGSTVSPVVPEWEALPLGTRGFAVTVQAARDYHPFGASFPNEYYFTDKASLTAHIEKAVSQAQARQQRQQRAGKF